MLPVRMNEVVRAIISAGVAALVATAATITTLTATTATIASLSATNATSTTLAAGTLRVPSAGSTALDAVLVGSLNVNVDSLGNGQSTTTNVTVTGLVSGDPCYPSVTAGDLAGTTSTISMSCRAGTDVATVTFRNATGTGAAFDAGMSTLKVLGVSTP